MTQYIVEQTPSSSDWIADYFAESAKQHAVNLTRYWDMMILAHIKAGYRWEDIELEVDRYGRLNGIRIKDAE